MIKFQNINNCQPNLQPNTFRAEWGQISENQKKIYFKYKNDDIYFDS